MTLHELKSLFREEGHKPFQLRLPDGSPVPRSFHITEVGRVDKVFMDCGGVMRESSVCQLQVWVGEDANHRIEAGKAAAILGKVRAFLPDETIPVEIEYEDRVISQYTISRHESTDAGVVLELAHKHTACLALERCGAPVPTQAESTCCAAGSGCCQ